MQVWNALAIAAVLSSAGLVDAQAPAAEQPRTFRDCADCPEMIQIPAGSFVMGSAVTEAGRELNEGPQRKVTIGKPFAMGKFELTNDEYTKFVDATGYRSADDCPEYTDRGRVDRKGVNWKNHPFNRSGRHPVLCITRADADAYIAWLSKTTGQRYRLPSEAEWEYAARAGSQTSATAGKLSPGICKFGNVADQRLKVERPAWSTAVFACDDGYGFGTAPVGSFAPNAFGLFDTQGNVWELTDDCYAESYDGAPSDGTPVITPDCKRRTVRGGGWLNGLGIPDGEGEQRSANRGRNTPANHFDSMGFRVARSLP